jgi:type IV pilus assembly protein PilC
VTQFSVRAGWPDGTVVEEAVGAADAGAARAEIERRGGYVFEVHRHGLRLAVRRARRRRIKIADFLIFNQELVALLKAGLPVVQAFQLLQERQKSETLKRVLADVTRRVQAGSSISEAFTEEGDLFPRLYATSLKAGEKSGEIENVLRRYLKYQKTLLAVSRKVFSTLVYPAILIVLSTVLIAILMTVVIPRFQEFFQDFEAQLPILTVIVIRTATFLRSNIAWIGGGLFIGVYLAVQWVRTANGALARDTFVLKIPVIGGILSRFAISQFTRSLATLLGGGTPLVPSLESAADAIGNLQVSRKVREVVPRVREGGELWKALEDAKVFSDLTIEMVKVGEMSGALEEMLTSVSEFYDDEIDVLLSRVISFVEPAILVIMGLVILTILLSVYLPIFTIMSQIKG